MAAIDVLSALMVFRIIGQINGAFVVHRERRRLRLWKSSLIEEGSKVNRFLGGLGRGDYFRFTGGQGDTRLLFRRPRNGGLPISEHPSCRRVSHGPVG
eukprot:211011-Pleurochrysis_carterae.AAC.1